MQLELDEHELRVARNVFDIYLPSLREQISNTERYELRQALKRDEATIRGLLERMDALLSAGAHG